MSLNGWPLKLCSWWNEIWNRSIKLRPRTVPFSVSADAILFSFFFRLPSRANCCHRLFFFAIDSVHRNWLHRPIAGPTFHSADAIFVFYFLVLFLFRFKGRRASEPFQSNSLAWTENQSQRCPFHWQTKMYWSRFRRFIVKDTLTEFYWVLIGSYLFLLHSFSRVHSILLSLRYFYGVNYFSAILIWHNLVLPSLT